MTEATCKTYQLKGKLTYPDFKVFSDAASKRPQLETPTEERFAISSCGTYRATAPGTPWRCSHHPGAVPRQ